jgi:hypothetical protein
LLNAQAARLCDRSVTNTCRGFDEFYGNLYHQNAEEEPELPDYPKSPHPRSWSSNKDCTLSSPRRRVVRTLRQLQQRGDRFATGLSTLAAAKPARLGRARRWSARGAGQPSRRPAGPCIASTRFRAMGTSFNTKCGPTVDRGRDPRKSDMTQWACQTCKGKCLCVACDGRMEIFHEGKKEWAT